MHPAEFMQKTSHRWYLTLVAHYSKDDTETTDKEKTVKPFVDMDKTQIAKAVWRGRLGRAIKPAAQTTK